MSARAYPRSAGFQTCCIADFKIGAAAGLRTASGIARHAGLETRDTADLEVCATGAPHAHLSLAPGFSRVSPPAARANRFNGLPDRPAETVETVPASIPVAHTWLKPGANESGLPHAIRVYPCHPRYPWATSSTP